MGQRHFSATDMESWVWTKNFVFFIAATMWIFPPKSINEIFNAIPG